MGNEEINNPNKYFLSTSAGNNSFNGQNKVERLLIISMLLLIIALLLILFNQLLIAGCLIVGSICIGILTSRKVSSIRKKHVDSLALYFRKDEKKDKIITDFSHKIRDPLNNLVITGEMLKETVLDNKQKDLLEAFIASTKIMVTTVNELTMESAENMNYESRKQIRFNLVSTVLHAIELYKLKDKVNIIVDLRSDVTSYIECIGDPIILKQILLYVLARIETQSIEKPTKVSINIQKEKETHNELFIRITISTDKRLILIDEESIEGNHASRLISLSKGNYTQETSEESTVLNISLVFRNTLKETDLNVPSTRIEELIKREKTHKELKDIRILLVEDNPINQKITLLTLKPLVLSIDSASNGKEALDMFGTNTYDLILMDILMPVMSGLTASEKIRSLESMTNSHVPIIAITANAMIGDKEKCLSAGIDDYISKPFQPMQLVEKIKQVIYNPQHKV